MKKEKVVIASGYFDPLHVGHVEYLNMAKTLGDTLVVIMDERDRLEIVFNLGCVDEVLLSEDKDKSVCKSIETIAQFKPMAELVFTNGGDRDFGEAPEIEVCDRLGIEMVDRLGSKIRSSSELTGLYERGI